MSLNKSTGNMYSWISHTWNTVKGECPHGCTYCYMKRWGKQNAVRFDESELKSDLGNGNNIFVGSSCDLFADSIPKEWIDKTINHTNNFCNSYLFQTKNPARLISFMDEFQPFASFCTTIETNRFYPDIMKQSPKPVERAYWMGKISNHSQVYVTIEPVMDFDLKDMIHLIKTCTPSQVNLGADSGNNHLPEPSKEKLLDLIDALKEFTVIDKKTNLQRLLK